MPSPQSGTRSSNDDRGIEPAQGTLLKIYHDIDRLVEGGVAVNIGTRQGLEVLATDIGDCQNRLQRIVRLRSVLIRGVRMGSTALKHERRELDLKIHIDAGTHKEAKWGATKDLRESLAKNIHTEAEEAYQKKEVFLEELKALKDYADDALSTLKAKRESYHEEVELAKLNASLLYRGDS
jgi:hypothetical protein